MEPQFIKISEFKAKCIGYLNKVEEEGATYVVTRRGKPIATIGPKPNMKREKRLGTLKDKIQIQGEIVETDFSQDWEVLKDGPYPY